MKYLACHQSNIHKTWSTFLKPFLKPFLALQNSNPSLNLLEIEAAFFILFQKTVYWPMLSTVYEPILF